MSIHFYLFLKPNFNFKISNVFLTDGNHIKIKQGFFNWDLFDQFEIEDQSQLNNYSVDYKNKNLAYISPEISANKSCSFNTDNW